MGSDAGLADAVGVVDLMGEGGRHLDDLGGVVVDQGEAGVELENSNCNLPQPQPQPQLWQRLGWRIHGLGMQVLQRRRVRDGFVSIGLCRPYWRRFLQANGGNNVSRRFTIEQVLRVGCYHTSKKLRTLFVIPKAFVEGGGIGASC